MLWTCYSFWCANFESSYHLRIQKIRLYNLRIQKIKFYIYVLLILVCPFVLFLLAIVLSVLRYTDSDCPFGIFKLFLFSLLIKCHTNRRVQQEKNIRHICRLKNRLHLINEHAVRFLIYFRRTQHSLLYNISNEKVIHRYYEYFYYCFKL